MCVEHAQPKLSTPVWAVPRLLTHSRCFMTELPKALNDESIIPQDYLGKWNSDLLGTLATCLATGSW